MAHEVLARIDDISEFLQDQSAEAEQLGRLPDATAKKLRESGLMRMLQPKEYGGYEARPNEFLEAVNEEISYQCNFLLIYFRSEFEKVSLEIIRKALFEKHSSAPEFIAISKASSSK